MPGSRPTVLVLGCASSTAHGRDQLRRLVTQLRRRGLRLVGADTAANLRASGARLDGGQLDEVVDLDVHDPQACRRWAAGRADLDAVLTFREMCVEPAAAVAAQLGLAGNDPAAVRTIRTKDLCRAALRAAGFRQPASAVAADLAAAQRFLAATGPGPWIVKPRDAMGSVGVSRVDRRADLPAALDRLVPGVPFLVETFVAGPEFSAEGVLIGGTPTVLALTSKRTAAGFVEVGHRMPATLGAGTAAAALDEVARALRAVGVTRGAFHVEFWLDSGGPDPAGIVLGELHARPGGDFIHAMVEHTRPGLELYGVLVDDLLGGSPPVVPDPAGAAGAEFLLLPPGTVRAVHGWPAVQADDAVIAADLAVGPGDQVSPVRGSADRHGAIVVGAASAEAVDATLRRLLSGLRVDVA